MKIENAITDVQLPLRMSLLDYKSSINIFHSYPGSTIQAQANERNEARNRQPQ